MISIRPEEKAVMLFNKNNARTAYFSDEELKHLENWAKNGVESRFIKRLIAYDILPTEQKQQLLNAIKVGGNKKAPKNAFMVPESIHIELTCRCPYKCSQCYKGEAINSDIDFDKLILYLEEAKELGVFQIALGGGEPLLYPNLKEVIKYINSTSMSSSITTGGYNLTYDKINDLISNGLNHMQVSLNGSTEKINSISRDGFKDALKSLELLSKTNLSFGINWVASMDNIDDLPNLIKLAKSFKANNINILRYKPKSFEDSKKKSLTKEKMFLLEKIIKETKGINLKVDSAFSNLLCSLNKKGGQFGGCGAGRRFFAINSFGEFMPCSHIDLKSTENSIEDYWNNSANLKTFREVDENIKNPCKECVYLKSCRGCRAISYNVENDFYAGEKNCLNI